MEKVVPSPAARVVPKVPTWASRIAWGAFLFLALWVFAAMLFVPHKGSDSATVAKWVTFYATLTSFGLASTFTFVAANQLGARQASIRDYLRKATSAYSNAGNNPDRLRVVQNAVPYSDEFGGILVMNSRGSNADQQWSVQTSGAFSPDPYHSETGKTTLQFGLETYVKMIAAEVSVARAAAAKIAATMGGLTLLMLQVYSRLA